MISGIWRRLKSPFRGQSSAGHLPTLPYVERAEAPPAEPARPKSYLASDLPGAERAERRPSPVVTRPATAAPTTPRPIEQLGEELVVRLAENEVIRRELADEEVQPLLAWAEARVGELMGRLGSLPPAAAESTILLAGDRLQELIRLIDLAVGQRESASAELTASRLELLDTLIAPPLFDRAAVEPTRARLAVLLAEPTERLKSTKGADLVRRLVQALT